MMTAILWWKRRKEKLNCDDKVGWGENASDEQKSDEIYFVNYEHFVNKNFMRQTKFNCELKINWKKICDEKQF